MSTRSAKHALLEQLEADGIVRVFGNPGTFEQGFLDALADHPSIAYIMGLQEAAVVAMALNSARFGRRGEVIQLHAGVGLGNAIGMLIDARRAQVPLLVYAGENRTTLEPLDGFLAGDLVALARPAVKEAIRIADADQVPRLVRRAWRLANTPPRGPVLLSIPMDILDAPTAAAVHPTPLPLPAPPPPGVAEGIADALARAARPLILFGDNAAWGIGHEGAIRIAERLGCRIYGLNLTLVGPLLAHPLFGGVFSPTSGALVAKVTREADVILAAGSVLGTEIFPLPDGGYLAPGARLFQVDPDPGQLGLNVSPELALACEPRIALEAIADALGALGVKGAPAPDVLAPFAVSPPRPGGPIPPDRLMATVAEALPLHSVVTDEAMTASEALRRALRSRPDVLYHSCISRGLGSGWPAGIAAKLRHPDRPVLAVSADGAAMYIIAALWTAAHLRLDVTFLVCNNQSYRVLKLNLRDYWQQLGQPARAYPGSMDLDDPPIRFDRLAEGMGLKGWRAEDEASLQDVLARCFSTPGPHVVDARMDGMV